MTGRSSNWSTLTPPEGSARSPLPELRILVDADGLTVETGAWPDRPDVQSLTLRGHITESGSLVFTDLKLTSDSITSDTPRLPIGDIRGTVIACLKDDPTLFDTRSQIIDAVEASNPTAPWLDDFRASEARARQEAVRLAENMRRAKKTGRLPGRPPLDDALLEQVAETYINEFPHNSRTINKAVTKRLRTDLQRPDLTETAIKNWVRQARQRGWLGTTTKGHPQATPGPRLIQARKMGDQP